MVTRGLSGSDLIVLQIVELSYLRENYDLCLTFYSRFWLSLIGPVSANQGTVRTVQKRMKARLNL